MARHRSHRAIPFSHTYMCTLSVGISMDKWNRTEDITSTVEFICEFIWRVQPKPEPKEGEKKKNEQNLLVSLDLCACDGIYGVYDWIV